MEGALILLIVYLIYHIYCKYAEEKGDEILHPGRKQSDLKEYSRYMDGLGFEDEENIFRCDNCEEPFSIYDLHRGPNGETLCFSCLNEGVNPEDYTENYIAEKEKIFKCDNCEELFSINEIHPGPNGETLCFSCLNKEAEQDCKKHPYVGSSSGKIFHRSNQPCAKQIPAENVHGFESITDAKDSGYRPCAKCRPTQAQKPLFTPEKKAKAKRKDHPKREFACVVSANGKYYHRPNCRLVKSICDENLIGFYSTSEPKALGFERCSRCKPLQTKTKPNAKYRGKAKRRNTYWGSATGQCFHRLKCQLVKSIKKEDLIAFDSIEEAKGFGYKKCRRCNP